MKSKIHENQNAATPPLGAGGLKIYIAGKVTGLPQQEVIIKFVEAQANVTALGLEAVNPLEVVGDWNTPWEDAMKLCIKALMDCDAIVALDDYKDSEGANVELVLAKRLGILIFTELTI